MDAANHFVFFVWHILYNFRHRANFQNLVLQN